MAGAVEQAVLILAERRQPVDIGSIDMDVAGRAGAAAATQRGRLVDAGIADHLHHRKARLGSEPIRALDGRTPEALVKSGKVGSVRDYLDHVALGGFASGCKAAIPTMRPGLVVSGLYGGDAAIGDHRGRFNRSRP